MTRKDYVLIAAALKAARSNVADGVEKNAANFLIGQLALALAQDNPRFDRARFLEAAGVAGNSDAASRAAGVQE